MRELPKRRLRLYFVTLVHLLTIQISDGLISRHSFPLFQNTKNNLHRQQHTLLLSSNGIGIPEDERPSLKQKATFSGGEIEFKLHPSISDIPAEVWDACLTNVREESSGNLGSPFLEHAWLRCLEESGCATEKNGWTPQHLSVQIKPYGAGAKNISNGILNEPELDGFVPVYIKSHSNGEFIFDFQWSDAAYRNGMDYYPKLLIGVPFTPVTGPRLLWKPWVRDAFTKEQMSELVQATGGFLKQFAVSNGWSSVHINFCTEEEASILAGPLQESPIKDPTSLSEEDKENPMTKPFQAMLRQIRYKDTDNYMRRTSIQYHWKNTNRLQNGNPFANFEEYLACFRSKRRIAIRRERVKVREDSDIQIDVIRGSDILKVQGLMERMFEIYLSTVDKMYWGRQYLTPEFFELLAKSTFIDNLCFLCARYKSALQRSMEAPRDDPMNQDDIQNWNAEDIFAGTFNVIKDGVFYGRYWGCLPGHDIKNLHFETCYWSAIEYCIERGLKRMEPGAGGADYKWARGFDPALIHSVHYICHPGLRRAVWQFLDSETEYNVALSEHLTGRSSVARNG